jgi:glycosidase
MADFKLLVQEAHRRGIRVIIDLVLNHTSSKHPFFQEAQRSPASGYHDWYIWSEESKGKNWHIVAGDSPRYYYGLFCDCMPDLNYANPEVTAQMENVVRYWLQDVGIDGFRVDAAKHLFEEGNNTENVPATHEWYKNSFYPAYKEINPEAYTVGEVFGAGATLVRSYTGDQLDQVFSFEMANGFVNSASGGSDSGVTSAIKFALQDMPDFDFATFLTNHDQNRVMSVLNGSVEKAKVASALLLTSPGTPFIYYGEEIGMQGRKPDEDIRLPMQWSGEQNAGFTTGSPWRPPEPAFRQVNVAGETGDPDSLLSHYRKLIALRLAHPALRSDGIWLVETDNPALFASLRIENGDMILVLMNLGKQPIAHYSLEMSKSPLPQGSYSSQSLMGAGGTSTLQVDENGGFKSSTLVPALASYSIHILELGK